MEDCPSIYSFDEISATEFAFKKFSGSSEIPFSYFSFTSVYLMVSTYNKPGHLLFFFLYFRIIDSFLIWHIYSYSYLSFFTFHYEHDTFFYVKFYFYILVVYSDCLYQCLQLTFLFFFFFFANYLMSTMYIR